MRYTREYTGDTFGAPQPDFDTYSTSGSVEDDAQRLEKDMELNEKEGPCWKGYEMIGWKEKDGKKVPNCVPIKEDEINEFCPACLAEYIIRKKLAGQLDEAEYQGHKVPLGKPMRGDVAKFKVYVKDPKTGNVKKVNFGDKKMRIKKSIPARRKSFRARHHCSNPGPRTKARYWSCRKW